MNEGNEGNEGSDRTPYGDDERGVSTIEYTMVLGFMSALLHECWLTH